MHTKHLKRFLHQCPECCYGSEDEFQSLGHKVSVHGIGKMVECYLCGKNNLFRKIPEETPRISSLLP